MRRVARPSSHILIISLFCAAPGCAGERTPSTRGEARSNVIYGQDDREEPYAYPIGSRIRAWAASSALQIDASGLERAQGSGYFLAAGENFAESMRASGKPLCPEEPFQDQPVLGGLCSAFLVAPDTVITAGHCVSAPDVCPHVAFVFGAGYDRQTGDPSLLGSDEVYFCERVLKLSVDHVGHDYAVVELDRRVVGRAPPPVRRDGKIDENEELVLIGNPLGLPTKIAAHGRVLDNTPEHFFRASTDSYGGESGAVIIGAHTGLVEGVLVRGEKDFAPKGDCWVSSVLPECASSSRGEDASRAIEFAAHIP